MLARIRSWVGAGREVASVAKEQEVTFLAAGVAYYAFVSLIPTAVLALVVATTFGGQQLADAVITAFGQFLTTNGQDVLIEALTASEGRGGATVIGVVFLLWGMLKVFRGLDSAFSVVYGGDMEDTLVDQLIDSLVVVVGIGLTMVLMFVVGGLLAALRFSLLLEIAGVLVLPLLLTAAFVPIYYRFPDRAVTVKEVLPGAAFAAVGWTVLQALFQLYASVASTSAYGLVGGVILLVSWLYIASAVIILGAVVNVVLADGKLPGGDAESTADRQFKGEWEPASEHMPEERDPRGAPDVAELADRVERLQTELEGFEEDVDRRTVDRPQLEADLKKYVRSRMRQGKARGWGPYLVLLYGTAMTLGAFYWLSDWAAVAAMFVIFTSTLGLYVMFVLFGGVLGAVSAAGGLADRVRR